jgi:hypothetical protein
MTAYDDQLRAIVAAVDVVSNERAYVTNARGERREVPVATERGPFLGLAGALYADCYSALPGAAQPPTTTTPEAFFAELRAANPIAPRFEDGWYVVRFDQGGVVVARNAQQRVVSPAELVAVGAPVAPGAPVRIAAMRELISSPYGHYVICGRAVHDASTGRQVRFYWSLAPDGAATFLREIGARLERRRIPFQAKVPVRPDGYARTDAGVLYLGDEDVAAASDAIAATYRAVRATLRAAVPLFARELAPGLAFAESPPTRDSFGMHRCDLIAEGLVWAAQRDAADADARLAVLRERLTRYGFDLDAFERNPTSRYPYRLEAIDALGAEAA